jgi:hypothetical protein
MLRGMPLRPWSFALLLAAGSCTPNRADLSHPAACSDESARALPVLSDAELQAASERTKHVVRARVQFTGSITGADGAQRDYVIVAPLEYLRGDASAATSRHREEFPLLAPAGTGPLARVLCREGDTFLFLVDLPAPGQQTDPQPASVAQIFGPESVTVHAVIGEHESARLTP